MPFTQTIANIISSLIATWMGLLAMGAIPDNHLTHWISVGASGLSLFMVHMGFNRTPNGTVVPDIAKRFIDDNADVQLKTPNPPQP